MNDPPRHTPASDSSSASLSRGSESFGGEEVPGIRYLLKYSPLISNPYVQFRRGVHLPIRRVYVRYLAASQPRCSMDAAPLRLFVVCSTASFVLSSLSGCGATQSVEVSTSEADETRVSMDALGLTTVCVPAEDAAARAPRHVGVCVPTSFFQMPLDGHAAFETRWLD